MVSLILPIYAIDDEVRRQGSECIRRIQDTKAERDELIIIENGSHHFQLEPADVYGQYEQPLGFAKALNIGLRQATLGYLCLISADIMVEKGWLDQFVKDCEENNGGPVCAGDQLSPHDGQLHREQGWGACWIIRRDRFNTIGLHDEELNHRFSDQDYWIRAHIAGFPPARSGRTIVNHLAPYVGSTVSKMPERHSVWQAEEQIISKRYNATTYAEWLSKNKGR